MYTKNILATDIVGLFENFLESKNIRVPCDDPEEETDRYKYGNDAYLYGMEYWHLVDEIEALLDICEVKVEKNDQT